MCAWTGVEKLWVQSDGEDGTFVGRVPTGCQRCHENRLHSDCEGGTFVGRVPTGCQRSHENRLQSDGEDSTFVGRVPTGCQRSHKNKLNWENRNFDRRTPPGCPQVLNLLFNLGLGFLLSHLLVTRFENCGTLCLTHLEKMDTELEELTGCPKIMRAVHLEKNWHFVWRVPTGCQKVWA